MGAAFPALSSSKGSRDKPPVMPESVADGLGRDDELWHSVLRGEGAWISRSGILVADPWGSGGEDGRDRQKEAHKGSNGVPVAPIGCSTSTRQVKSPIIFGHFTKYHRGGEGLKISNLLFFIVYQATQFSGTYIDIYLAGPVR